MGQFDVDFVPSFVAADGIPRKVSAADPNPVTDSGGVVTEGGRERLTVTLPRVEVLLEQILGELRAGNFYLAQMSGVEPLNTGDV